MSKFHDYLALTKVRLTGMVVCTTALGFAWDAPFRYSRLVFFHTLMGTWLTAAGSCALNQYLEWPWDALMHRTQSRPLPQGRLTPKEALSFGAMLIIMGALELALCVNLLTASLAVLTVFTYLVLYTPMKRKTALCTLVGAIPGAIPPLMGWAGAHGHLSEEAWILFAILFMWQLPHFLAIAWMYRDDYARAGFPMLPVLDPAGGSTARMIILYSTVLIPITLLPTMIGKMGLSYFWGALMLGVGFLSCGACTAFVRTQANARRLMFASVIYLPLLLAWMMFTKHV